MEKRLFVVGDSISIHYGPYLEKFLDGNFLYDRKGKEMPCGDLDVNSAANGGDCLNVLEYLKNTPDKEYDILLLNCGLHDIKINQGTTFHQVETNIYRETIEKIIKLVLDRGKKIVWVSSTPVDDERHNRLTPGFLRYDKDIVECNKIASEIMNNNKIQIIDLYTLTKKLKKEIYVDHIHFNELVREIQAAWIAGQLIGMLKGGCII